MSALKIVCYICSGPNKHYFTTKSPSGESTKNTVNCGFCGSPADAVFQLWVTRRDFENYTVEGGEGRG